MVKQNVVARHRQQKTNERKEEIFQWVWSVSRPGSAQCGMKCARDVKCAISHGHRGDLASGHGARAAELRYSEVLQSCAPSRDRLRTQDSMFWMGSKDGEVTFSDSFL